jgi:hypothetical protein
MGRLAPPHSDTGDSTMTTYNHWTHEQLQQAFDRGESVLAAVKSTPMGDEVDTIKVVGSKHDEDSGLMIVADGNKWYFVSRMWVVQRPFRYSRVRPL